MEKNQFIKTITFSLIFMILATTATFALEFNTRGDIVSFFRTIHVPSDTQVRGDVISLFGDVDIQGDVSGDVIGIFGRINVDGRIIGDTVSVIGGITIGSAGRINGDSLAVLGHGIDNHGSIRGQEVSIMGFAPIDMPPLIMLFMILAFIILINQILAFGLSVIAVLIFKDRFNYMATTMKEEVGKKFLVGLLVFFGTFVGIAILVLTLIGAPLVILLIPALLILQFLGNTTAKISIGRRIAHRLDRQWSIMMELLVGTLIYVILEITILGKVFTWIWKFIGIGEIINSRLGDGKTIDGPKGV